MDKCQTIEFCGHLTLLEDPEGRVSVFSGAVLKKRSSLKGFCSVFVHYIGIQCMDLGQIKSFLLRKILQSPNTFAPHCDIFS